MKASLFNLFNSIAKVYGYELMPYMPSDVVEHREPLTIDPVGFLGAPTEVRPIGEPVHPALVSKATRGIRNNNPGNIDLPPVWQGCVKGTDPRFCTFKNMAYGCRAMALLLVHYQTTYKLLTVRQIINRWAPPGENDTGAYVAAVANACQVSPDAPIVITNVPGIASFVILKDLTSLVKAIVMHENGAAGALVSNSAISLGATNALGMVPISALEGFRDGA